MVTVLLGSPLSPQLYTFMGVEPGDLLIAVDRTLPPALSVTVNGPLPMTPPAGTTSYTIAAGPCTMPFNAPPVTLGLEQSPSGPCVGVAQVGTSLGAAFPLLVEASGSQGSGTPVGFTFQKGNAITATDDAGVVQASLTGTWSTQLTTQTIAPVNAPDGGVPIYPQLSEVADGVMRPLPGSGPNFSQFTTHVGYADFVQAEAGTTGGQGAIATATRSAPPTADGTISLDVSSLSTAPTFTGTNATMSTPGQPTVAWTIASGSLSSLTGIVAQATWLAPTDGGASQSGTWTLVSPATGTSIQAPALPVASNGWGPQAGATFNDVVVYGVQGSALPTYAQVRAAAAIFPNPGACLNTPLVPPLPAAGSLTLTVGSSTGGC
jgi:hypothetical protein